MNDTDIKSEKGPRYSEEFNDGSAEVVYESSDGVRFRIHTIYLNTHTGGLSPGNCSLDEVARLTEPSLILETIFKFIYPSTQQPALQNGSTLESSSDSDFENLRNIAEAAEKYLVFPAMYACFIQMRSTLPNHALSLLGYALKHDYHELANEAAPYALDFNLSEVMASIPVEFHRSWLIYYNKWLNVQKRALTTHRSRYGSEVSLMSELAKGLSSLRSLNDIVNLNQFPGWSDWQLNIAADIAMLPSLSDVIGVKETTDIDGPTKSDENEGTIVIESPDGQNNIKSETLEACGAGFGPPIDNKIQVSENCSIIGLLLQFLQPVRSPDLRNLEFAKLKELAFSAEKYSISQAIWFCRFFMKNALPDYAQDVFQYAARFRYLDILDEVTSLVLPPASSFEEIVEQLPAEMVVPWAKYYQTWEEVSQEATTLLLHEATITSSRNSRYRTKGYCDCGNLFLDIHIQPILERLLQGPGSLRNLDELLEPTAITCGTAINSVRACRELLEKSIKDIASFSNFIQS